MGSRFISHEAEVRAKVLERQRAVLDAMGAAAVDLTVAHMRGGYSRAIRQSGALMRDVSYEVARSGPGTVDVGNTLPYAVYVHEGLGGMAARPYLRDALLEGVGRLKAAAEKG